MPPSIVREDGPKIDRAEARKQGGRKVGSLDVDGQGRRQVTPPSWLTARDPGGGASPRGDSEGRSWGSAGELHGQQRVVLVKGELGHAMAPQQLQ